MWLSDLSIKRPVFISMVVLTILVVGALTYSRMPVDLFPDIAVPVVVVQTVYSGASPEEIETQVSKPIEEAVSSLNHVDQVRSTSQESVSRVMIEFDIDYPIKDGADDVRQKVATIKSSLPADADEPQVLRVDPSSTPIFAFAFSDRTGAMSPVELRYYMDHTVVPRIQRIAGVGAVSVDGGQTREVHVDLILDRLRAQSLPVQQVVSAIAGENVNVPGGRVVQADQERLLRTTGEFRSIEDLGAVPLVTPGGGSIYLRDVATIEPGFAEQRSLTRLNGRDSVTASIQKQSGTNTVQVAEAIKAELSKLEAENPSLEIQIVTDQSVFTRESTVDVLVSLVFGAILAGLVVLLFFRDVMNTLVTVAGLPMIILGSFIAMNAAGFTVNMVSLLALSLSIGMLIDDAIVVRENIFRHVEEGEEPKVAAGRATGEIALAVLATTFTIVAVFAPIGFTSGIGGKFLREFGLTVVFAVLLSLFEAFTLAPMLSAYLFRRRERKKERASRFESAFDRVAAGYRVVLSWALGHRLAIVGLAVVASLGSGLMVPVLGRSFIADFDRGELTVNLEMPAGATLEITDQVAKQAEQIVLRQPETESALTTVGASAGNTGVDRASIQIKLKGRGQLQEYQSRLRPELAKLPVERFDVDTQANSLVGMMMPTSGAEGRPIQISVQGDNLSVIDSTSSDVMHALAAVPGIADVDRTPKSGRPEVEVVVDRPRAADAGISTAQIGSTIRTLVNGDDVSTFKDVQGGGQDVDIVVRLRAEDRDLLDEISRIPLVSSKGALLPLSSVADLSPSTGASSIQRRSREREVLIGAGYVGRQLGEVTGDAEAIIQKMSLPGGVTVDFVGQSKYMNDVFSSLTVALGLAVLFVYVVLASQFGSISHPFTIMLALPLSFIGGLGALLLTGKSLDMMALIGLILLMGLVTKNSILLVDFTNKMRERGYSVRDALLHAGPIRLRPILMTTLAMIFGMLPIALGYGAGSEIRVSMAIVVIGGLLTSTVLTLVVVPVGYTLVDDLGRFVAARGRRHSTRND